MDRLAGPQPVAATRRLDTRRQRISGRQFIAQPAQGDPQQAGHLSIGIVSAFIIRILPCHIDTPMVCIGLLCRHEQYHSGMSINYWKPYIDWKGIYGDAERVSTDGIFVARTPALDISYAIKRDVLDN